MGTSKLAEKFDTLKALIIHILDTDERARNSDKWLIYRVLRAYTDAYIPFEDIRKIPSFGSIERERRRIQNNKHQHMPTDPEVIRKRAKKSPSFQAWAMVNDKLDEVP